VTRDELLQQYDRELATTRLLLERIPVDKMDWRPHHRGQLSVYLRLNDIPVPSIYGPTADEPAH
jgi:hypothetical protein